MSICKRDVCIGAACFVAGFLVVLLGLWWLQLIRVEAWCP